jgi:hypothetical protein
MMARCLLMSGDKEILVESHLETAEDVVWHFLHYLVFVHLGPYSIYFVRFCREDSYRNLLGRVYLVYSCDVYSNLVRIVDRSRVYHLRVVDYVSGIGL